MTKRSKAKPPAPPVLGVRAIRRGRLVLGEPVTLDEVGVAGDVSTRAHYADPRYYDKAYAGRREDLDYYVRLAREVRAVLEYGAGNGRITIPLARAGSEVVAVDHSEAMLADLRARLKDEPVEVRRRVRVRHGDMRSVSLRRRFRLVIAPFNTILHLYGRADVEAFLGRVRRHLAPAGRFVFDFSVPRPEDLALGPERGFGSSPIQHPSTGGRTRYRERFEYDPIRQVLLVQMEFTPDEGEPWSVPLTHRQFFPTEMEALLHYNGFEDIEMTADFTRAPPDAEVDSMVVSCRPTRARRRRTVARSRRRA